MSSHQRSNRRGVKPTEGWNPTVGDLIVSNWTSTVEILWLAFRFDPIFVLPVHSPAAPDPQLSTPPASPITHTPGRRTGTGSAAISSPATRAPTAPVPIVGFREVSLLSMLSATGHVVTATQLGTSGIESLQQIRSRADRPVVVFPECTTSNGRGLLRFSELFKDVDVPVKKFRVFLMCARFDPPTALCPSMTHPIPSMMLNPLSHIFTLTTSLIPLSMSIKLLSPTDSPSSGTFLASEFITQGKTDDILTEACAALIAQIGKIKRVGLGWEDKRAFLEFYRGKRR
ncbi:uncharacterized protein FIBRA_07010 [Fibroporia radiculosa]|uniref:Phospholipid/glycerol acyltransferase domain-containing protein n=1 Tax=Fibroporia radiculosa TaxID=599839 RepID=J4I003_9APHY|nr:uncharacterized protein FIBRA_07010 [Fibroporia radiculosa]CCM04817.1 predicted protein [Fibroporia radiculosa]